MLESFAGSPALTLGVELELQIVNTQNFDLAPHAEDLLRLMRGRKLPGEVKPEITLSMVELSTGVCQGYAQALSELREIRSALVDAARRIEVGLCGGGTHPFQNWKRQRIYSGERFHRLSELYGYLSKQFTIFGQHVHVGCPGPEAALCLLHGLSRFVPHLIALAASSPFVQGEDTGFASSRLNSVFAFPLSGRAPFVRTWDEFRRYFSRMTRTGVVESMKDFYWDIRPKPEFGTIEVRVMDTPLTVEKAAALAGLIQCIARWLQQERPFTPVEDDYLVYTFNRFQACRFGLDGTYVDPGSGEHRVLREDIAGLFERLRPHASELRAEDALDHLQREIADSGNDSNWLRQLYEREHQLPEIVRRQTLRLAGESED